MTRRSSLVIVVLCTLALVGAGGTAGAQEPVEEPSTTTTLPEPSTTTVPTTTAPPAAEGGGPVGAEAALTNVAQVVNGDTHSCARLTNGTAMCWGRGDTGQRGDSSVMASVPTPVFVRNTAGGVLTGIAELAAGGYFTCARMTNGNVRCWGKNDQGQIGIASAAAFVTRAFVVKSTNGAGTLTNVTQISAGLSHACARRANATAVCWGYNLNGQLGDGTTVLRRRAPVVVKNGAGTGALAAVAAVAAGGSHSCARRTNGSLACFGRDSQGELGTGVAPGPDRNLPIVVRNPANSASLTNVAQVVTGSLHMCAPHERDRAVLGLRPVRPAW